MAAPQQVALVTIGVAELDRSRRYYQEGFGWTPIAEDSDTILYNMNGFVLATWLYGSLTADMRQPDRAHSSGFSLAHCAPSPSVVDELMRSLIAAGGVLLRAADTSPFGSYRGYVADPDGHPWEILHSKAWRIDDEGRVTFRPGG